MNSSSRTLAVLSRLLWKEYRVQRSLWLALLFLGVVPQIFFWVALTIHTDGVSASARCNLIWSLALIVPFLFVIGSTAILFAGEREAQTSDWLISLAAPPQWLLMAKCGFIVASALGLALSLSMTAFVLVWSWPWPVYEKLHLHALSAYILLFAGVISYGVLASLLSRGAVVSVAAMGLLWFLISCVPCVVALFIGRNSVTAQKFAEIWMAMSVITVAAFDIGLGWRWCEGKYLDIQFLSHLNTRISAFRTRMSGQSRWKIRILTDVEAANRFRREWQRLVWQERHRDSSHKLILAGACLLIVGLVLFSEVSRQYWISGILPGIACIPLAMGILGFRDDGQARSLQFLAQRGVSSSLAWVAKHAIWLPRAICIPLLIWSGALLVELPLGSFKSDSVPLSRYSFVAWVHFEAVLWLIVLGYGCGQLAATHSRQVFLAITMGIALNVISAVWIAAMVLLQVPLWWSVGGVAIWLFAMAWFSAPERLLGRPNQRRLQQTLMLTLAPPILIVGGVGGWRAVEVAGLGPFSRNLTALLHPQETFYGNAPEGFFEGWSNLRGAKDDFLTNWTRNVASLKGEIARQSLPITPANQVLSAKLETSMNRSDEWLATIFEVTGKSATPLESLTIAKSSLHSHIVMLSDASQKHIDSGQFDDALKCYCASLRLATLHATGGDIADRETATDEQSETLQKIVAWANHPNLTAASLWQAVDRVNRELLLFPTSRQSLFGQYRVERGRLDDFINRGMSKSNVRNSNIGHRQPVLYMAEWSRFIPWERYRARRLLEHQMLDLEQFLVDTTEATQRIGRKIPRLMEAYKVLLQGRGELRIDQIRLARTTPLFTVCLPSFSHEFLHQVMSREEIVREALLALALLAWKKEHGKWPESLGEVLTNNGIEVLPDIKRRDPRTGSWFEYRGASANRLDGPMALPPLIVGKGGTSLHVEREVLILKLSE